VKGPVILNDTVTFVRRFVVLSRVQSDTDPQRLKENHRAA
jgi:hypothetical protein